MTDASVIKAAGRLTKAQREITTSELATILGVPTYAIRKWKARGFLALAPIGRSGQGRGVECYWSVGAVEEARRYAAINANNATLRAKAKARRFGRRDLTNQGPA